MRQQSRQRSVVVLLDDEPMWVENHVRIISRMAEAAQIRLETFYRDDLATQFVQEHADEIIGFVQDLNRGSSHEYTGGVEGVRFLDEVIARYTPSARTLVVSASAGIEQIRRIYTTASYQAEVLFKTEYDEDAFRSSVLWLLNLAEPTVAVARSSPWATSPCIDVMDLPWEEIRDYLTKHPDYLHLMNPRAFEKLGAELFRTRGWEVELTARTRDGGYDIIAVRRNQPTALRALIEAKRFSPDRPVGVAIVRALDAVRNIAHASQVVLATSSRVSSVARQEFFQVVPWELDFVERDQILAWCREHKAADVLEDGGV